MVASIVAHLLSSLYRMKKNDIFGIFSQVDVDIILISTAEARLCPQRFYCVDLVPDGILASRETLAPQIGLVFAVTTELVTTMNNLWTSWLNIVFWTLSLNILTW